MGCCVPGRVGTEGYRNLPLKISQYVPCGTTVASSLVPTQDPLPSSRVRHQALWSLVSRGNSFSKPFLPARSPVSLTELMLSVHLPVMAWGCDFSSFPSSCTRSSESPQSLPWLGRSEAEKFFGILLASPGSLAAEIARAVVSSKTYSFKIWFLNSLVEIKLLTHKA